MTLTLGTAVAAGAAVTVAYTDPSAGNDVAALQDAAGNDAATLAATAVSNITAGVNGGGGGGGGSGGTATPTGSTSTTTDATGNTTVVNNSTTPSVVPTPPSGGTVTSSGSGPTTVSHPGAELTLNNTGTGTVTTSGITNSTTLSVTGSGSQAIDLSGVPAGSTVTIHNTGSGTVNVSNLPDGVIVNVVGIGPVTLNDADGASQSVENNAPALSGGTLGDGNGDHVADALQSNVTSLPFLNTPFAASNPGTATPVYMSLVADSLDGQIDTTDTNSASLSNVQQLDRPANAPADLLTPTGLISFSANVGSAGVTESFSLYADPSLAVNGYWKTNAAGTWVNLASADYGGKIVSDGGKTRLDFKITDGGQFDSDGKADGVISDPGALGYRESSAKANDTDGDQFPDSLEAANGLKVGTRDNDVFGSSKYFAMQLYRDILAREGDSGGVQYWQGQIDSGLLSRAQVASSFLASPEFQGGAGGIARLYLGALHRLPDSAGMAYWEGQNQSGTSLAKISGLFAASAEFGSIYGTLDNSAFLDTLYQNVLNRSADAAGKTYWNGQLDTGIGRGTVVSSFAESAEGKATLNTKVNVALDYIGLLGRAPEQTGFDGWVQQQDSGTPEIEIIGGFIASPEYHGRFLA